MHESKYGLKSGYRSPLSLLPEPNRRPPWGRRNCLRDSMKVVFLLAEKIFIIQIHEYIYTI